MSAFTGRRFLGRIEWVFFAVLVVAAAGVWIYQSTVVAPVQRCENAGNWWDAQTGTCGHVVYLPAITHRPIGSKRPSYPTLPQNAAQAASGTSGVR